MVYGRALSRLLQQHLVDPYRHTQHQHSVPSEYVYLLILDNAAVFARCASALPGEHAVRCLCGAAQGTDGQTRRYNNHSSWKLTGFPLAV